MEVIRRGLVPVLVGRRFLAVKVGAKRLRQQSSPAELRRWVLGRRLEGLRRRGKYLLFDLEGGVTLLIHLGMTGRLLAGPTPSPPLPHVHLVFQLEGGLDLFFQDTRRFGQVLVFPPGVDPPPLAQVGAEPFSRKVTPAWLAEQARGRSRPIKNFLLDARILAGIGNIYACEILFAARLHPATPAGRLTLDGLGPGAHRDQENPQARHQRKAAPRCPTISTAKARPASSSWSSWSMAGPANPAAAAPASSAWSRPGAAPFSVLSASHSGTAIFDPGWKSSGQVQSWGMPVT